MKRRQFTQLAGVSVAALSLGGCSGLPRIPVVPKNPVPKLDDALAWISLRPDGRWQLLLPRTEMGQNISTTLRRVAAAELGVAEADVVTAQGHTGLIARTKITAGSDSVHEAVLPLARACYALRAEVLRRGAESLNTSTSELQFVGENLVAGTRSVGLSQLSVPFIELKGEETPQAQLRFAKAIADFKVPSPSVDHEKIVRGAALYAADIALPGMLYACVLRPQLADQAQQDTPLLSLDEAAIRAVAGFHSIVRLPSLAGPALVATRMGALLRMREAAAPQWTKPSGGLSQDVMQTVDVDRHFKAATDDGAWAVDFRLDVPPAAHASIEPRCAVAQMNNGGVLKLWCGNQSPFFMRDVIAKEAGIRAEKVQVQPMRMGGSFGGKTFASVELEAAVLALELKAPVKVQWSRADEFLGSAHRPPSSHRVRAKLSLQGKITQWQHALSSSHVLFTNAVLPLWMQQLTDIVGDKGPRRGHQPLYGFDKTATPSATTRLGFFTGPWRGLGAGPNVLAMEMAMDQAAFVAKADPIAFRLAHLEGAKASDAGDPARLAACFKALQALKSRTRAIKEASGANWLEAEGSAGGSYKGFAYSAASARVAIQINANKRLRAVKVLEMWCTHDCGQMLDPDGVRAQIEGNLMWCLGMMLMEKLDAPQGIIAQQSLAQYPIPRITDTPHMHIEMLNSNSAPSGAGETAMVSGAGAIANAVMRALRQAGAALPTRIPFELAT